MTSETESVIVLVHCDNTKVRDILLSYLANVENEQLGIRASWVEKELVIIKEDE